MMKMKLFLGLVLALLLAQGALAQTLVTGKVTDPTDFGIPGANVLVKGQAGRGTITNMYGEFSLEVDDASATLVVSFIGMETQEVALEGRARVDVVLREESKLLQDVIVTAIGIKEDAKALGYAAQQVGGQELADSRETNIVNAIGSRVAGVEVTSTSGSPGASANIVIRGRTSLSGSNSPLFVVDGVPIDNSFDGSNFTDQSNRAVDLNSNDVESVTVLKGPAAAALYGLRAANGAIIITTKRGSQGQGRVELNTSFGLSQVNKLPQMQMRYAQGSGGEYQGPPSSNATWGPLLSELRYDGDASFPYDRNGRLVPADHPDATSAVAQAYDNANNFFETGLTSNTHFSLSGGNGSSSYFLSAGYLTQQGIIPNSTFERTTVKTSGSTAINEKISVSGTATYSNSGGERVQRGSNLSGVMLSLMRTPASFDIRNGLDDPAADSTAYMFPDGTQRTFVASYDNPYWSVNKNRSRDRVNRLIGNGQVNYQVTPWLSAMYRLGIDYYSEERKTYWDNNSNEFGTGVLIDDQYNFRSLNSDLLLTAERQLSQDLKLTVMAGHNFLAERGYNTFQEGETFILPNFYDISNVSTLTLVDDRLSEYRLMGAYYNLKLAFRSYLYLTTTGRNDWSSTLRPGANTFFYPSVNLGFIFTEPLGMADHPVLGYGKLRLSYAQVGNDAPRYSLRNYYTAGQPTQGQLSYLPNAAIGNIDLRPERTSSIEAGLELRFFQNRLALDLGVYQATSIDQIVDVPIAFSSGFSSVLTNAGVVQNVGLELMFNATPVERDNFTWDITWNFAANENTVVELAEGITDFRFESTGLASTSSRAIEGEPFGVIFGTRWMRDPSGQVMIDDLGYPLMDTIQGIVGDPNPDFLTSIRNSFAYKGLSFNFLWDVRKGGDVFNGTVGVMKRLGTHASTEDRDQEVVVEGVRRSDGQPNQTPIRMDEDYYARYPFAGVSEAGVEDGSWLRLREIGLRYSLPARLLEGTPMQSLTLGATARNVLLFTRYTGIDPETNLSGASNSFGRDYFNTPNVRSVEFTFQVVF